MKTKIIEATNGSNWGKFLVGRFDEEWKRSSTIACQQSLLESIGWTREHIWVVDLQTGEGAFFRPGGSASADLQKHRIWVCQLFEPFLEWLYRQDLGALECLPEKVELKDAPFSLFGYRRAGLQAVDAE